MRDPVYVLLNLASGMRFQHDPDILWGRPGDSALRIGARLFAAGLLGGGLESLRGLSSAERGVLDVGDVVREIVRRKREAIAAERGCPSSHIAFPVAVIVHIDEFQCYVQAFESYQAGEGASFPSAITRDARAFLKEMLDAIGGVMQTQSVSEPCGPFVLLPIITGTSIADITSLPSQYARARIDLERWTLQDAKELFLDVFSYERQSDDKSREECAVAARNYTWPRVLQDAELPGWSNALCEMAFNEQHFQVALHDTGFVAYPLAFLVSATGRPDNLRLDFDWGNALHSKAEAWVKCSGLPGGPRALAYLLALALLEAPTISSDVIPVDGAGHVTVSDAERTGMVFLMDGKIRLPFAVLRAIIKELDSLTAARLSFDVELLRIPTKRMPWTWEDWESLHGEFHSVFVNTLLYHAQAQASAANTDESSKTAAQRKLACGWKMSEVFRGARFSSGLLAESKEVPVSGKIGAVPYSPSFIFRCAPGCALFDYRFVLASAAPGAKPISVFVRDRRPERV
eukprot:m51a1_g13501 hypothetical protein (516) ;mRNA; r:29-1752